MKRIIEVDPWKVVETSLHPEDNRLAESLMSIGNGHMGMRGNFEETYTGETHEGTYIGGVYYPDKTRVGWWKNGYPEYFAKVLNAPNVTGLRVVVQNEELDLHTWNVMEFKRELDMRHGLLRRSFTAENGNGEHVQVDATRFFSIAQPELIAIQYEVTPINFSGTISFQPFLNGDVRNEDANYDEDFWEPVHHEVSEQAGVLTMKTRKTEFEVSAAMRTAVEGADDVSIQAMDDQEEYIDNVMDVAVTEGQPVTFYKYVAITQSRDYDSKELAEKAQAFATEAFEKGYDKLLQEHQGAWEKRWKKADVTVGGDEEAQQGIRYNIFQLYNTYTGDDPRLNIGPKGFTGEKYGGSTYWDTEAYCLPFYLGTADPAIARNLLIYRYNHLDQARANARKLGLEGALYPMVTMNGEESHNEWEITFEEIHRNGAIAHAIWNYTNYTGDTAYLSDYGFEVLAELSRFWASRVNYNPRKDRYMILGVTGPNEYENNVNNNWYTNRIAAWTLEYTLGVALFIERQGGTRYNELFDQLGLSSNELDRWKEIISKMYYPYDEETGVYLQQDGFLDKEIMPVGDLEEKHLPLNQNWSWDRILRSCFIKQADVLQGMYFLNHKFTKEEKKRNYNFYEPMTVHESSLSPCVHSILAAELGYEEKAYEMYVRTARLDLDNYNNDTEDGLHITSMAGSWLSIVHGFAGMRVVDGTLHFNPMIPEEWKDYSFKINFRGHLLKITVNQDETTIEQEEGTPLELVLNEETRTIESPEMATP
ncbi:MULTISPECIES: glycoside hydrolase family 65 protein [Pontibacillus]|uniref:Glycoside hydrolase family 65 protein n=1 Tax=Pontibacillus chungwhensis TaxID=265426 RepID=A0ABY8V169_9BACI|nr:MULTISPECIES: glycoside hydrolase family 65 protein [Pontibacillus]MCD5325030.1 glycoside hydrolase family 65 protein [Pontibacillus sp. HN14]WIF98982.1 glycoside hydrolase family 65 protein [Pontibacillus chungwhensis]